jgi:hypothetical protein
VDGGLVGEKANKRDVHSDNTLFRKQKFLDNNATETQGHDPMAEEGLDPVA